MDYSNITIIIPALNEQKSIGAVIQALNERFPGIELLVVDDGSTDDTAEIADNHRVKVLSHEKQRGYGAALCTGIKASTKDYVLFCDADGQHSVEDVERLIAAVDDFDMVVGARKKEAHNSWSYHLAKLFFTSVGQLLLWRKIPDLNSGLRVFKKAILEPYLHLMPDGFSFTTTSTFTFIYERKKCKYIPIEIKPRIGKGTVSIFRHGSVALLRMFKLALMFRPVQFCSSIFILLLALILVGIVI